MDPTLREASLRKVERAVGRLMECARTHFTGSIQVDFRDGEAMHIRQVTEEHLARDRGELTSPR